MLNACLCKEVFHQLCIDKYHENRWNVHDPGSRNCAVFMSYTCIIFNSTELHLQGVAPRSQYSDSMPEAVTPQ